MLSPHRRLLPLVLSPVTLKNCAGTCGFEYLKPLVDSAIKRGGTPGQRAKEYLSYLDVRNRGEIADDQERESLMRILTTLYLTDGQIDRLLVAAARLIRNDPEFRGLMQDLQPDN